MSFAQVRLYAYGLDRSRGDVPIFATAAAEAAAGAGTGVTTPSLTFSNVKVRRDPYPQSIEVSIDASNMDTLELCDVAVMKIGSVDRWYWITGYEEVTNSAYPNSSVNRMNVRISLDYIPVTTGLTLASTMDIIPERMPAATPRVMQNWTQSIMRKGSLTTSIPQDIGQIPNWSNGDFSSRDFVWVEVVYADTSGIRRIGWFSFSRTYDDMSDAPTPSNPGAETKFTYPGLTTTINKPLGCAGLTGTVYDICISEFCPYGVKMRAVGGKYIPDIYDYNTSTYLSSIYAYIGGSALGSHYIYFDVDRLETIYLAGITNRKNITITLTDFEKHNANIQIRDTVHNAVMTIPPEKNDNTMTITSETYSDTSGIYTRFTFDDQSVVVPGTHLPFASSIWENYRNFNMQFDRQAVQNNIDAAQRNVNVAITSGISNGIVGGVIGGALTGGPVGAGVGALTGATSIGSSILTAQMTLENTRKELNANQQLTEQRMQAQPSTIINCPSGAHYIKFSHIIGGSDIIALLPSDFLSTDWDKQTALWGYPSNKVRQNTVSLTAGYWKGRIMAFTSTINNTSTGELNDLMVRQFDNGLRLKQVS